MQSLQLSVSATGGTKTKALYEGLVQQFGLEVLILAALEGASVSSGTKFFPGDNHASSGMATTISDVKSAMDALKSELGL